MKHLVFAMVMFVLSVSLVWGQDEAITWELVSIEPVSPHGAATDWNSIYNEPGAVIYYEGQYHLFVNGYSGFPSNNGIGYRVSDDGINYEWATEEPILRRDDMPNEPLAVAASDVLVLDDGTWVLYFFNFNSSAWPRIRATIGRATASNPTGPWTVDDDPILTPEGDNRSVAYASVLPVEDGFVMYYIVEDRRGVERLARATSEDGITWEKETEPVFELDATLGEGTNFVVNQVVFDGERWIMAYKFNRNSIGFAFSEDGITWERYADNPVLSSTDIEGLTDIGYLSLLLDDMGQFTLFFEGNIGGQTQVYAAYINLTNLG